MDARLVLPVFERDLFGELSLDAKGEAVREVAVEVQREGCVSTFALEVADVSWSTELRLEMLASRPELLLCGSAPGLSILTNRDCMQL